MKTSEIHKQLSPEVAEKLYDLFDRLHRQMGLVSELVNAELYEAIKTVYPAVMKEASEFACILRSVPKEEPAAPPVAEPVVEPPK